MAMTRAEQLLQLPYGRVLIPEKDGGYSAYVLEFKGCYSCGETLQQSYALLYNTAISWLESMLERGLSFPLPRDMEETFEKVLGQDGVERLRRFISLKDGWDFGSGRSFNLEALELLEHFCLVNDRNLQMAEPSIMVSPKGNPLLCWEHKRLGAIELEFEKEEMLLWSTRKYKELRFPKARMRKLEKRLWKKRD